MATPITYPAIFPQPWASVTGGGNYGGKNTIPIPSASPLASLADGFPSVTMLPISSGGIPPAGQDFNGILNWITQHTCWVNQGGQYYFSSTLAADTGGYPIGAVLQLGTAVSPGTQSVVCTLAGNMNNPNVSMTGWTMQAPTSVVTSETYTATAGQTLFPLVNAYAVGVNAISVFMSGSTLTPVLDYTETSSTSITLVSGAQAGDTLTFKAVSAVLLGVASAGQVSYLPSGTGAVQTSVQTKLQQTVSVLDFGADPTGATDSSTAIQNCFNAAASGGNIIFPPGTYLFATPCICSTVGATLSGGGTLKGTILLRDPNYMSSGTRQTYITVAGLTFTGTSMSAVGIQIKDAGWCIVKDCFFQNMGTAIQVPNNTATTWGEVAFRCTIQDNKYNNVNYFVQAISSNPAINYAIADFIIRANQGIANITHLWLNTADGLNCYDNTFFGQGYTLANTAALCHIFVNQGVWLNIHDNHFFESGTQSIWLNQCSQWNIHDNHHAWPGEYIPSPAISITAASYPGSLSNPSAFTFTATCATNQLNVTAITGTPLAIGSVIVGPGIPAGTFINSLGSGTGGTGTYNLSTTPGTIASNTFTSYPIGAPMSGSYYTFGKIANENISGPTDCGISICPKQGRVQILNNFTFDPGNVSGGYSRYYGTAYPSGGVASVNGIYVASAALGIFTSGNVVSGNTGALTNVLPGGGGTSANRHSLNILDPDGALDKVSSSTPNVYLTTNTTGAGLALDVYNCESVALAPGSAATYTSIICSTSTKIVTFRFYNGNVMFTNGASLILKAGTSVTFANGQTITMLITPTDAIELARNF